MPDNLKQRFYKITASYTLYTLFFWVVVAFFQWFLIYNSQSMGMSGRILQVVLAAYATLRAVITFIVLYFYAPK